MWWNNFTSVTVDALSLSCPAIYTAVLRDMITNASIIVQFRFDEIRTRESSWNLLPSSLPTCLSTDDILVCTVWLTAAWWVIQSRWSHAVQSSTCSRGIYQEPVQCFPSLPTNLSRSSLCIYICCVSVMGQNLAMSKKYVVFP